MSVFVVPAADTCPFRPEVFRVPDPTGAQGPVGPAGPVGTGDYGLVYTNAGTNTQALAVAFAKLVGVLTTNGPAQGGGVTPNAALDQLIINTTGDYMLWIMVHVSTPAGAVFSIQGRRNGIALPNIAGQETTAGATIIGAARAKGAATLTAGDVIEIYGASNTSQTTTFRTAQLFAKRLA